MLPNSVPAGQPVLLSPICPYPHEPFLAVPHRARHSSQWVPCGACSCVAQSCLARARLFKLVKVNLEQKPALDERTVTWHADSKNRLAIAARMQFIRASGCRRLSAVAFESHKA